LASRKHIIPAWLVRLKVPYSFILSASVGALMIAPTYYKD